MPPISNGPKMLPDIAPLFDKIKLFAGIFFQNTHFDDSGISLHAFLSITNLELHSIPLLSKIAKKYFFTYQRLIYESIQKL